MDFSHVDWWHTLGVATVVGAGGAAVLATLPISAPILAIAGALGVTVTGATIGLGAGVASAVGQAKAGTAAASK